MSSQVSTSRKTELFLLAVYPHLCKTKQAYNIAANFKRKNFTKIKSKTLCKQTRFNICQNTQFFLICFLKKKKYGQVKKRRCWKQTRLQYYGFKTAAVNLRESEDVQEALQIKAWLMWMMVW